MRLKGYRPSPAMVVAVIALIVAMTGVTWAATTLPRNSVGSAQVRDNSVRSGDIRDRNVRAVDIGTNAIQGRHVGDNQIGGNEILESNLGQVPSAVAAVNAERLAGRPAADYLTTDEVVPFAVRLSFGEKVEFISNGPVGLEADCRQNISAQGQDELRMLAVTRQDGAFMQGDTPHSGPGVSSDTLNTNTPEDNRTMGGLVSTQAGEGQPAADDDIDTGFVAGPNGEYIGVDETTMYALRVGGSDCLLVGVATVIDP